jgi:predicted secreted protein
MRPSISLLFALFLLPFTLQAEPDSRHIVSLSASASQAVENDTVTVRFAATAQDSNPAEVIQQINQQMQEALDTLQGKEGVTLQTGNYQVNPVYEKNRLTLWRGAQTLILQTQNLDQLPDLLTQVQNILPYQSMRFSLSTAERQRIEKELIPSAISNLKTEAKIAMQSFSAHQALPLETVITTHNARPAPLMRAMAADNTPPAISAGQSVVQVSINGKFVFLYQ